MSIHVWVTSNVVLWSALGQLVALSDCVCPGHELRLECTVVGGGAVWRGSAFDCHVTNEIILLHFRFISGTSGVCNNG